MLQKVIKLYVTLSNVIKRDKSILYFIIGKVILVYPSILLYISIYI
jgi:hypothetical protein